MSKFNGMVETRKIDRLLSSEELDRGRRHALLKFQQDLDAIIMSANQQVLKQKLPDLNRESITRLAVRVAELRGTYLAKALKIAQAEGAPDSATMSDLHQSRMAFEEMREAFEGLERVVERGYSKLL